MRISISRTTRIRYGIVSVISMLTFIAIPVVSSTLVTLPFAATTYAVTPPDSCFAFNAGTGTITNYYDFEGNNPANPACPRNVDIPSTIGGSTVLAMSAYSMSSKGLTALTLPSTLTNYSNYSFAYNQITELVVPEGITSVGQGVFRGNNLTQVTLPSTLTSIGDRAFTDNDLPSVNIPDGVTYIGPRAFYGNQLTSVTIPASVQDIASEAFIYNYQLSTIIFEGTVTTFGSNIFTTYPVQTVGYNGSTYTINDSGPISEHCFAATGGTIDSYNVFNLNVLRDYGDPCIKQSFIIPDTINAVPVTALGDNAMWYKSLVSITMPSTLTSIGASTFEGNGMVSVVIPDTVTSIGVNAFRYNPIASLQLPQELTDIGAYAFASNALSTLNIPENVISIGDGAFQYNNLTAITFGGTSLTSIGSYAFRSNQLTSLTIPNGVTSIGIFAFRSNQLTSLTIPGSVTSIGDGAFYDNQLTSLSIGSGVTNIGIYAFGFNQLTSLTVPGSVTTIGERAFYFNQLTSITIGSGVTNIGRYAFRYNRLTNVDIPNSVSSIGYGAFGLQSQWGADLDAGTNGAPNLRSVNPTEVQTAIDSIWYARLYTEDPSNPNNLTNSIMDENYFLGADANANGVNDSLGGHIINPASFGLHYVNQVDTSLQAAQTFTGMLSESYIHNYFITQGPVTSIPANPLSPTPLEQQAIDEALSAYYRIGDSVTIAPPAINGYITPPTQTFVLGAADNQFSYVYALPTTATGFPAASGGRLAETGMNVIALVSISVVCMILASITSIRRTKSYKLYR